MQHQQDLADASTKSGHNQLAWFAEVCALKAVDMM
jgi:hypothetical protein